MVEQDSSDPAKRAARKPQRREHRAANSDEFERFRASKALTDAEKAALPAGLRRLLGWE